MKGNLRLEVIPIEGEWERRNVILQICKEAIEKWRGDSLTSGYVVEIYHREERGGLTGNKKTVPFLYIEAIAEHIPLMKIAHCARCKQEVHFYQKDPPKTINCPRCGATDLIVREKKEGGING